MSSQVRRSLVLIVTSCAATLALVATVNVSCGNVSVKDACAQDCPDVATLEDRLATLEGTVTTLMNNQADLQSQVTDLVAARSGRWQLIDRRELTAAASQVEFAGLDGEDDVEYLVRGTVLGASDGLELSLPSVGGGSRTQRVSGRGSAASAFSNAGSVFLAFKATTENPEVVRFEGVLHARTGQIRTWLGNTAEMETTTPSLSTDVVSGYWSDTTSEVTSIVIAPFSGTIAGGSVFELYRRAP